VAIDKFNLTENSLPLDTLDDNIVCKDALFSDWVKADAIIGNPPFLGGKHIRLNLGDDYVDRIFEKYPKDVDFCSYWFRLAHDNIDNNGRVGLVATNSISQGKSRKVSLDYINENGGYIHEAISTQEWSGEAAVHVSIVNWCKIKPDAYFLDHKPVNFINSSLTSLTDVTQAKTLNANLNMCFQGVSPVGMGFIITEKQAEEFIKHDSKNSQIIKLFSMGANLAKNPHGKPDRLIIDFADMSLETASEYELLFKYVKQTVKPERDNNRMKKRKENWWQFGNNAINMRKALKNLSYYFAVPEVSKWAIFIPCDINWISGNKTKVVISEDYYILGILTSKFHRVWMNAQKSTLKADIAYTHKTCFETFPFPQTPTKKIVEKIRETMIKLHEYRTEQMEKKQWGITQLYNQFFTEPSSQLYKLHQQLDKLAMEAYEFNPDDDLLEKLLKLNLELAEKEERGEKIVGCWDIYQ
jgi:hypothetical protein